MEPNAVAPLAPPDPVPAESMKARRLLGGLTLGQIPIAGSKHHSIAISLQGGLYRIGKIPANKAFVIIRGNLRLLYVSPDYNNYRYAAKKVFGASSHRFDIDHALGRKLTLHRRYWYTLVTRLDPAANRSHGWRERPPAEAAPLSFDKFCYTDERILRKILGLASSQLPDEARTLGYEIVQSHERTMSLCEALKARRALGMSGRQVHLPCLHRVERRSGGR